MASTQWSAAAVLGAGALAILALLAGTSNGGRPGESGVRLPLSECRLQHPNRLQSVEARCGKLEVPENPADARSGSITLRVAVVPALNRRGAADPLFVLAGGPGQAATDFYASLAPAFARIQRDRDIVLLDQRGTGGSHALNCDYPEDEELADLEPEQIRAATRRCLEAVGGRPAYYTTSIAVRDLDAVRRALGYGQINLYGISYGTRVAQHYLRRFPDHTRSMILDGVVPPEQILGTDSSLVAQLALEGIFARCRAETACAAAFGDPQTRFRELLGEIGRSPAEVAFADPVAGTVIRAPFRLAHLQTAVRLLSYSPDRAALLPLLLDEAARHDNLAPLAAQARMVSEDVAEALSYGMHHSVVCSEDAPFFETTAIDRRALEQTYLGTAQLDGLTEICKVWPRGPMDSDFHAPLSSDVPVLLLSGSADPVTPPAYAERARASLSNSLHIVLEGQGHGQLAVGCVPRLMSEFIAAGTAEGLQTACAQDAAPAPFFTSFAGPTP